MILRPIKVAQVLVTFYCGVLYETILIFDFLFSLLNTQMNV